MKRILIMSILLLALGLHATAAFYPTSTIAENFGAEWCGACGIAEEGLNTLAAQVPADELSVVRLLTESGPYTTPAIDARFDYYDVMGFPVVMFNGKIRIDGSGEGIADGSRYLEAFNQLRYAASPLKMNITSFDANSGAISLSVELLNPTLEYLDANVLFYLVENNVTSNLNHIVRDIKSQRMDITYTGSSISLNETFAVSYSWNLANLWAVAFVQAEDGSILQSAKSIAPAAYRVQAAVPFERVIHGEANTQYYSPAFYIYNMGAADTFTRQIEIISAPEDWYFNYCDVDGNCYPGSFPIPTSLAAGAFEALDLNISVGSPGTAVFNFVISSDNLGVYKIPFKYIAGMSNSDLQSPPLSAQLKAYPNPFSHSLSFEIESEKALPATQLQIYNLKGQLQKSLTLEGIKAGKQSIEADLGDLPSGVYLYRLQGSANGGKILKIK